jgi:hypothetical protein
MFGLNQRDLPAPAAAAGLAAAIAFEATLGNRHGGSHRHRPRLARRPEQNGVQTPDAGKRPQKFAQAHARRR